MARRIRKDSDVVYRAVIIDSRGNHTYYGPYSRKGDATTMVTRETKNYRWNDPLRTGRVEVAVTVWGPADA